MICGDPGHEEVIKAFGQPTTAKPWNSSEKFTGHEQLEYKPPGLRFILEDKKVINIMVDFRPPAGPSAGQPNQ